MKEEKLFKLKEEARPYFHDSFTEACPLMDWYKLGVSDNALEPVDPEKVVVHWNTITQRLLLINDHNGTPYVPNEQEIEDIQRLLNLGGFKSINNEFNYLENDKRNYDSLDEWLKEKGL